MLRPATDADVEAIRTWRNHPEVRAVSLTQDEIDAETHARWWAGLQGDASRRVLVYERGGLPCGVVTFFDIAEAGDGTRSAMWGYYLDNAGLGERGRDHLDDPLAHDGDVDGAEVAVHSVPEGSSLPRGPESLNLAPGKLRQGDRPGATRQG